MHPSFFVPSRAHQDHPRLPEKHRRPDGPAPRDYPHQSVNAQHYWKTLARQLALLAVLQFDDEQEEAWNEWVHNHPIPAELNRLFVVSTSTRPFQLRATIILLVPHVTAFTLFARPLCHNYRNLLHISRLWFPRVASFAPKEQAWVVKLLLLSAHTPLAQEADLRHYAWCAAEALTWSLPLALQKKLINFLEDMLAVSEKRDTALFARIKKALAAARPPGAK